MAIFSRRKQTTPSRQPKLRVHQLWPWNGDKAAMETTLAHAVDPTATTPADQALFEAVPANPRRALHYLHDDKQPISGNVWHQGSEYYLAVIGQPEAVIARSDLTDTERERATLKSRQLATSAGTVIAIAERTLSHPIENLTSANALTFVGLVALEETF